MKDISQQPPYDLEERTARFGEAVIDFLKLVPVNPVTSRLIDQLVGAGTSIGANYCEADDAVSKKEFRHKIGTCKKEARECKFFIRMIVRAVPGLRDQATPLWQEAKSPDLRQNLPIVIPTPTFEIRNSSFLRHWVFRHSSLSSQVPADHLQILSGMRMLGVQLQ
jgi:four helix bundle protein